MNAQTFLDNFGYILNAPNGIYKIKDVILSLAFQGKLAKHSSDNVNGSLEKIDFSQQGLRRKHINEAKGLTGYHAIPHHWQWVTLDRIGHDWGQTKPSSDFTYIDVSSIDSNRGAITEFPNVVHASAAPSRARKIVKKGTVIYSTVRPYLKNIAIVDKDLEPAPIASTAFAILSPYEWVDAKYIYYYLRSPTFVSYVESVQSGIAYPAISDKKFFSGMFPLAPKEEQKRIVTKVNELMALCDKLEVQQQERERTLPVLSRALHARLSESPNAANLRAIFQEVEADSPDDIRKSILSLAFKGKLVQQEPEDEPASILLETIARNLPSVNSRGRKSQTKRFEPPYSIPNSWVWARFPELGEFGRGKSKHRPRNDPSLYIGGIHPLVQTGDVSRASGTIKTYTGQYNDKGLAQSKKWPVGTLCITIAANIADTGILGFDACFPDSVVGFIPSYEFPSVRYFEYFMRTAKANLEDFAPATAQKNINLGILEQVLIPIPPVAEQQRIVDTVDKLMSFVDELEKMQNKKSVIGEAFAQAAIATITGTQTKEHEKMKAPKTELITLLQSGKKVRQNDQSPLADIIAKHKGELSAKDLWQQSGLKIDAFYQQLKTEMVKGWIIEPEKAIMKEMEAS